MQGSQKKRALVLGLGPSGEAAAAWLLSRGLEVVVMDSRAEPPRLGAFRERFPDVRLVLGKLDPEEAKGVAALVLSPGLSPFFGAAVPVVGRAKSEGAEVFGEIECFARELERLKATQGYAPKVVGITGTNGKTTTTVLTTEMLKGAGLRAHAAGNIGPNAVSELMRLEAEGELPDVWVLELSSFQLATTTSLRPDAAALLNVTEDHLNWHGSMAAYADAKRRIFAENTVRVLNRDDEASIASQGGAESSLIRTFGKSAPENPGDYGLLESDGLMWLSRCEPKFEISTRRRKTGATGEVLPERLMPVGALRIAGRHNAMNALAALALVEALGAPLAGPLKVLEAYRGERHRVERVMTIDGVDVIDDSKGTNVGAVAAAVTGFADEGRRLLILLGGDGKGQDFSPLAEALRGRTGLAALIGRDAEAIGRVLEKAGVPHERFETLEAAVEGLWARHRPGDVLLLSPACASWDMFRDYAERSERFIAAARAIAERVN